MSNYLIKNALVVNEGKTFSSDVLIKNGRIEKLRAPLMFHINWKKLMRQECI